jgi:hypothetical protein
MGGQNVKTGCISNSVALHALNTATTSICHALTPLSSGLHYCFRWKLLLNAPTVPLLLSRHFVLTARMADAVIGLASPATSWSVERATTHQQLAPAVTQLFITGLGREEAIEAVTLIIAVSNVTSCCLVVFSDDGVRRRVLKREEAWKNCTLAVQLSRLAKWLYHSRLPTAAARVRVRVRSCGICGGQRDAGGRFPPSTSVSPCLSFHRLLYTHHHSSSGAGTIGQIVTDVTSELSITPRQGTGTTKLRLVRQETGRKSHNVIQSRLHGKRVESSEQIALDHFQTGTEWLSFDSQQSQSPAFQSARGNLPGILS